MKEQWKEIEGFDGKYLISNSGKILSKAWGKSRLLNPYITNSGYEMVTLRGKPYSVHRLVAKHFIPNPQNLPEVNHKDEDKLNNCAENLEWCNREYNRNYGTRNERISKSRRIRLEEPLSNYEGQLKKELKEKQEEYIKEHQYSAVCVKTGDVVFFGKQVEMAEFFGCSQGLISRVLDTDRPIRGYYLRHVTVV